MTCRVQTSRQGDYEFQLVPYGQLIGTSAGWKVFKHEVQGKVHAFYFKATGTRDTRTLEVQSLWAKAQEHLERTPEVEFHRKIGLDGKLEIIEPQNH